MQKTSTRSKAQLKVSQTKAGPEKKKSTKPRRSKYSAKTSDRYELYQLAVQSPERDVEFLTKVFKKLRKRPALHFREDFCGTALLCATWAQQSAQHTAEGFDLDPEPLAWGKAHNLAPLGRAAERITLHRADVRSASDRPADVRVAQNFSYNVFRKRAEMLEYFARARASLAADGIFVIDIYGGYEAIEEMEETRKIEGGFTYVWDQARYLPGTGEYTCHIHFRFRDGTKMEKAFSYVWRYWNITELEDVLAEAGFREVQAWFEQSDDPDGDGEGNGQFARDDTGKSCRNCAGWIAYLVALA